MSCPDCCSGRPGKELNSSAKQPRGPSSRLRSGKLERVLAESLPPVDIGSLVSFTEPLDEPGGGDAAISSFTPGASATVKSIKELSLPLPRPSQRLSQQREERGIEELPQQGGHQEATSEQSDEPTSYAVPSTLSFADAITREGAKILAQALFPELADTVAEQLLEPAGLNFESLRPSAFNRSRRRSAGAKAENDKSILVYHTLSAAQAGIVKNFVLQRYSQFSKAAVSLVVDHVGVLKTDENDRNHEDGSNESAQWSIRLLALVLGALELDRQGLLTEQKAQAAVILLEMFPFLYGEEALFEAYRDVDWRELDTKW